MCIYCMAACLYLYCGLIVSECLSSKDIDIFWAAELKQLSDLV